MTIFEKVLEIYQKYYICTHCLGRMFSLLATETTNYDRGSSILLTITMENHRKYLSSNNNDDKDAILVLKLIAENANFSPAKQVLVNEGIDFRVNNTTQKCFLCENIFSNLEPYIFAAKNKINGIEFNNFLVGSSIKSEIINKEDSFKAEFNLLDAESFKTHFNREVGKQLSLIINKPTEFGNPEMTIIFHLNYNSFQIDLLIKSLFISGRYNKFIRGIPQTHWECRACRGKGCKACNGTGKQYINSVEELVNPEFLITSNSTDSKFHGAGREDIDVKMLGTGRPFILELKNPKIRSINLNKIQKRVNHKNKKKIRISNLNFSNKDQVKTLKANAENTRKTYRALVRSTQKLDKNNFITLLNQLKMRLENQNIDQRTPIRVSHRRVDKYRQKKIFTIQGFFKKPDLYEFIVDTQGGTYIKELINGDNGRTKPSFTDIFGIKLQCEELDVLKIH